jgi:hypothetical protein
MSSSILPPRDFCGLDSGRRIYNFGIRNSSVLQDGDGIHRQIRLRKHLSPLVFPALQVDYHVALRLGATD